MFGVFHWDCFGKKKISNGDGWDNEREDEEGRERKREKRKEKERERLKNIFFSMSSSHIRIYNFFNIKFKDF